MKPADMLHQMCHGVLAGTDVKALCKAREFPPEAESSRGVLETLFLSKQGLDNVFNSLEPSEVALLHLLKHGKSPVDVAFFADAYHPKTSRGTFHQRFQNVFASVKQRLVRSGVLLLAEATQGTWEKKSKMELWRFALPAEFHDYLPPLIQSPRQFDGDGKWRPNVVFDKLSADLGRSGESAGSDGFQIVAGELRLNGKRVTAPNLAAWQQAGWQQAMQDGKKSNSKDSHAQRLDEAASCILSELVDDHWANTEQLGDPLRVFCGRKVNVDAVCEAGWEWGLLAKRRAAGKNWYRLAPSPPPIAPHEYLTANDRQGSVTADLKTIPFNALEQVVAVSNQQASPARNSALLLTPDLPKLGRADDTLLGSEAVQWLVEHTEPFAEAYVKLSERRGKTILHENVYIARVSDLSLKVAIEKALGSNLVSLKNDFVAFPRGLLDKVRRVVTKSGHVVKEVAADGN